MNDISANVAPFPWHYGWHCVKWTRRGILDITCSYMTMSLCWMDKLETMKASITTHIVSSYIQQSLCGRLNKASKLLVFTQIYIETLCISLHSMEKYGKASHLVIRESIIWTIKGSRLWFICTNLCTIHVETMSTS